MKKIRRQSSAEKESSIKKKLVCLLILFVSLGSQGQSLFELGSKLSEMKMSGDSTVKEEAKRIESLVYDLHPMVYIDKGTEKVFGESNPVRVCVDASSVNNLKENIPLFNSIELITIRLENESDLNFVLDLSDLKAFKNLKYVNFIYCFESKPEDISTLYIPKPGISVFYHNSVPE